MPDFTTITLDESGAVARLRLSRPAAGNRVNGEMLQDLQRALEHLEDSSRASILVVQGAEGQFCGGMEWEDFERGGPPDVHAFNRWERLVTALERLPKVTVAVVEGRCSGAGLDLVLASDRRLAAADCVVELPEVREGLLPSMVTYRLPKYVGMGMAKRLLLGARLSGSEAHRAGIFDDAVPRDTLAAHVERVIDELSQANVTAIAMARRLLTESYATPADDSVGNFLAAQARCMWKQPETPTGAAG
jgi:enoyl-CoA hydratase/carnithine racemase